MTDFNWIPSKNNNPNGMCCRKEAVRLPLKDIKTSLVFLLFMSFLIACNSKDKGDKTLEWKTDQQEIQLEDQKPTITYPIKITQRNLKEQFTGSERIYSKYDSIEITQVSDSSYFFQYFKNGRARPNVVDTLTLPEIVSSPKNNSIKHHAFSPFWRGRGQSLYVFEIGGKSYKVIESRGSCCAVWEPRGHVHQGTQSYFSLDFGMLGAFQIQESRSSKTLWMAADWDQETVNQLIDSLPLSKDDFRYPLLSVK